MHLDKEKTVDFINKVLFAASFLVNLTPNTNDNAVVATLQRIMANKDLVDLVFEILEKIHTDKKADLNALVVEAVQAHASKVQ